jgi:biopolymer transport protein ExbB/TolQ
VGTLSQWRSLEWLVRADVILLGTLLGNTFFILFDRLYYHNVCRQQAQLATMLPPSSDVEAIDVANQNPRQNDQMRLHASKVGFGSLASTATCAPLLGFLGTLFGILDAFQPIGMEKAAALKMIALAVAEALATTAMGILVAVVASWCHSYLRGYIRPLENDMASVSTDFTRYLASQTDSWEVAYDRQLVVSLAIWSYLLYVVLAFPVG